MKKSFIKIMAIALISALALSFGGCKETLNGSVIERADFKISYVDGEGATQTINSTLTLYETFAPETTKRVKELISNGYYNDTVLTLSKQQDYAVVGGFTEGYATKAYSGNGVKGEFTNNGLTSELVVTEGALVMLRDFDISEGGVKYNTAKASFAIVLSESGTFNAKDFCVFGYIDSESLATLKTALTANAKSDDEYLHNKYVGKRVNGTLTSEGAFEYYTDANGKYYKLDDANKKVQMEYDNEEEADYETVEIIREADNAQDIFVLPATTFKVSASMQSKSGCA